MLSRPYESPRLAHEVKRELGAELSLSRSQATILTGMRRCGKSTLQAQLMRHQHRSVYCNFEDTRLFGLGPDDFTSFLTVVDNLAGAERPVFLDEVQEVEQWQRLVRALLDRGRAVCLTGSNASLLGRELGSKLTGRHLSFEVFPFDFAEYLAFVGRERSEVTLRSYLDDGGFPLFLQDRRDQILQELLRDVVQRDVTARHRLRETRQVMKLLLFLWPILGDQRLVRHSPRTWL